MKEIKSVGRGNYLKKSNANKNSYSTSGSLDNRDYMKRIYESLSCSVDKYKPQHTVTIIKEYLGEHTDSMRLMYSELSNYLFSIKEKEDKIIEWYTSNLDSLLTYVGKKNIDESCRKIVFKIYDHSTLVKYQKEGIKKISEDISRDMNKENEKMLKESEKQYITILGIFAAIVLAFTGGIAFSTSVLSNIDKASIYRLVFVTALLGFILFNTICVMFEFVREINSKSLGLSFKNIFKKPLWSIPNIVFIAIMIISTCAYLYRPSKSKNVNLESDYGMQDKQIEIKI